MFAGNNEPTVSVSPKNIAEAVGGNVSFTCNVGGRQPVNIRWQRADGRQLPSRAITSADNTLTIVNVQVTDAGRYICLAYNSYGRAQEDLELVIIGRLQIICNCCSYLNALLYSCSKACSCYVVAHGRSNDSYRSSHRSLVLGQMPGADISKPNVQFLCPNCNSFHLTITICYNNIKPCPSPEKCE